MLNRIPKITKGLVTLFICLGMNSVVFAQSDTTFQQAVNAIASGESERAISLLEAEEHLTVAGYYNLGIAFSKQERWSEALWAFEAALKLDPNHEDAIYNATYSLQQIDERAVWNHPFSWGQRTLLRLSTGLWYTLVVLFSLTASVLIVLFVRKTLPDYKQKVVQILIVGSVLLGLISFYAGFKTEQHFTRNHYVTPLEETLSTYASKDGVKLETTLLKGQRYPYLSETDDWIQVRYTDDRPVWVMKMGVRWY